jgi:hypothetical protein
MSVEFKSYSDEVKKALIAAQRKGMRAVAITAKNHAVDIVPVDTGRLRNSLTYDSDETTAIIGTNVEYAPTVEKRKPYITPAVMNHAGEYKSIISEALGEMK